MQLTNTILEIVTAQDCVKHMIETELLYLNRYGTVGTKIIPALEKIRVKKLIPYAVLCSIYL